MALISPILDDRSYQQLREELLRRIPIYTKEWTDYNASDPGTALLELFAYLGESLLYRFNQIPDTTKIEFLRLLGVQPRSALPAAVLLAASTELPAGVQISKGVEVRAGAVSFETIAETYVWPLECASVGKLPAPASDGSRAEDDRREDAKARVGLTPAAQRKFKGYSLGMKQRLAIAAGLLRPRELIILDEPTNGLDPQGTREVRALIRQIAADGTTVFVSSHLLAEVEQICTHVGVMRTGKLVFQGSLPELRRTGASRVTVQTADPEAAAKVLTGLGLADAQANGATEAGDAQAGDAQAGASAILGDASPEQVCAELVQAGIGVRGFAVVSPSLEDLFVGLTGEGFDVSG
jgi:ABC-2 type transport system ATP-binding protein